MLNGPKSPESFTEIVPPAVVAASAVAKSAQGAAKLQGFESLPDPETHV
jgi:hypothetical protein